MSTSPLTFTGVSTFSEDFLTILERAVDIASLPVEALQNDQTELLTKKQLLTEIRLSVETLTESVSALASVGESSALTATSSDSSLVTVTLTGADQPAAYTISEITSVAEAASETSLSGYATSDGTAVSDDGILELVVGENTYEIDISEDNNLDALAEAINDLGAGVSASVINTGTGETPYYLSLTANSTGEQTLELRETAGDSESTILTTTNQGSNAVFKLNGIEITKTDNVISDVIDGVTFTIVGETDPGETVDIELSSSRDTLSSALSDFVEAYNEVREMISTQVGEEDGQLNGDYIIRHIQSTLRELTTYWDSSGDIRSLTDLGIEIDLTGEMSLNTETFEALSDTEITAAFEFLGSTETGFGALASSLEAISDSETGLIAVQQDYYDEADERISDQIDSLNTRIEYMESTLTTKLQQYDTLLAELESQQAVLEASLEALNALLYGDDD